MNEKEEWLPVSGYEGLYEVSNLGRVKSLYGWNGHKYIKRTRILKGYKRKPDINKEYACMVVALTKSGIKTEARIHVLVANEFVENPQNLPYVNHIDSDACNNVADNLEWVTQSQNIQHAYSTGSRPSLYHSISREELINDLNNGTTYDELATKHKVAKGTIFNIIKRLKIRRLYI